MKTIAVVACAAALSSCVVANPQIPVPVSAELARICRAEPVVHAAFAVLASQGMVPARLISAERHAHLVVTRICADPPTDAASALATASAAYADVLAAQATAAEEGI